MGGSIGPMQLHEDSDRQKNDEDDAGHFLVQCGCRHFVTPGSREAKTATNTSPEKIAEGGDQEHDRED